MRVVAGEFRSRVLVAPPGLGTRPTSDRLRETLFNVLGSRVQGARFADLFAGSGAVGIEALSRGARDCLFVEHGRDALAALRKNVQVLQLTGRAQVDTRPVLKALAAAQKLAPSFDLMFLDPPYQDVEAYTSTLQFLAAQRGVLLAEGSLVVAEHARRQELGGSYGALQRIRVLEQGDAALSFYELRTIGDEQLRDGDEQARDGAGQAG